MNSFGYGGSNAHCVLDDAFHYLESRGIKGKHFTTSLPPAAKIQSVNGHLKERGPETNGVSSASPKTSQSASPKVFLWSAADEGGLQRLRTLYQNHLSQDVSFLRDAPSGLENLAYTLAERRSSLPWKMFAVADSFQTLQTKLAARALSKPVRSSRSPCISFIFTGQGAQWAGMGLGLCGYRVFESSLEKSAAFLQLFRCEWNLHGKAFHT